jgi:hypothetical protein
MEAVNVKDQQIRIGSQVNLRKFAIMNFTTACEIIFQEGIYDCHKC